MALATLRAATNGAVRDPLDGGFFRYANDAEWRFPYFQKHLIDQARMALALLDAAKVSGDSSFTEAARSALHFVLDQLPAEGGGFVNAIDATAEPTTAAHLWTMAEIKKILGDATGAQACTAFGVTAEGNLSPDAIPGLTTSGKNILYHADATAEKSLGDARTKLLKIRTERATPLRDNVATSGAHGLLLAGLARAGVESTDARLSSAAETVLAYVRDQLLTKEGSLRHLAGRPDVATASDYAMVIEGLLTFKSTRNHPAAGELAQRLISDLNKAYLDPESGRYFATDKNDSGGIWARVYTPSPSAGEAPSPESLMLTSLVTHQIVGEAEPFARAMAAEANDSAEAPRGDLLLALQAFAQKKPQ
jgi:uncharacterized protein YyaL (SSP411 family)